MEQLFDRIADEITKKKRKGIEPKYLIIDYQTYREIVKYQGATPLVRRHQLRDANNTPGDIIFGLIIILTTNDNLVYFDVA